MTDDTTRRAEVIRETTGVPWEYACTLAERERDADRAPADRAPSIAQFDACNRILREYAHPLANGYVVHGHSASYGETTGIYWLCVFVTVEPDEIFAEARTLCFPIRADGGFGCAHLLGWESAQSITS